MSYPKVKTWRRQGSSVFPGGNHAKVNPARGWSPGCCRRPGFQVRVGTLGSRGGETASPACRQSPDALAVASLEGEMNSLLPSSVFSPEHLHSNWEIWAFSCFSARSCQSFPLPKRGLVVGWFFFFFSSPFPLLLVPCNLLPAVYPVEAVPGFYSMQLLQSRGSFWGTPCLSHPLSSRLGMWTPPGAGFPVGLSLGGLLVAWGCTWGHASCYIAYLFQLFFPC